jgi:hypothetical protein
MGILAQCTHSTWVDIQHMADKNNLQAVADSKVREDKPFVNAHIHKLAAGKRAESLLNFGQRY